MTEDNFAVVRAAIYRLNPIENAISPEDKASNRALSALDAIEAEMATLKELTIPDLAQYRKSVKRLDALSEIEQAARELAADIPWSEFVVRARLKQALSTYDSLIESEKS